MVNGHNRAKKLPSQAKLAQELGISPAMVSRAKHLGMPTHSAAAAREWRRTHLDPARVKRAAGAPAPSPRGRRRPPLTNGIGEDVVSSQFEQARTAREVFEAKLAQLRYDVATGRLVNVDDLRAQLGRRVAAVRDRLLRMPDRLAPVILGLADVERVRTLFDDEIRAALAALDDDGRGIG